MHTKDLTLNIRPIWKDSETEAEAIFRYYLINFWNWGKTLTHKIKKLGPGP